MDPFTQRMLQRAYSAGQLLKHSPKSAVNATLEESMGVNVVTKNRSGRKQRAYSDAGCYSDDLSEETSAVMNRFLADALGSEIDRYDEDSKTPANPEVMSLTSEVLDAKSPTPESLHYTVSGYRALTQSRQSKIRRPLPSSLFFVPESRHGDDQSKREKSCHEILQDLQKEMNTQKIILHQITKALIVCRSSKDLQASGHRVESERLLLHTCECSPRCLPQGSPTFNLQNLCSGPVVGFTPVCYNEGLGQHDCQKFNAVKMLVDQMVSKGMFKNNKLHVECGSVELSDLTFNVSPSNYPPKGDGHSVWLACVLAHEDSVFTTQAMQLGSEVVVFPGTFPFTNLLNNFVIKIHVYSLTLKNPEVAEKHCLKKILKSSKLKTCPFQNALLTKSDIFETSDFHLEGILLVTLKDLKPFLTLKEVSYGQLSVSLRWSVEQEVRLSGFLTVREDSAGCCGTWDRRWCLLEACRLKFWNYPNEKDCKPPLGKLNLVLCKTTKVQPLDRAESFKPHTFLLEMENCIEEDITNQTVSRYLLSTDTREELTHWCTMLNETLSLLAMWNARLSYGQHTSLEES